MIYKKTLECNIKTHNINMLDYKNLHLKIREIRIEIGLTQEQFAAKLGVSFLTVNRWENQKTKPSPLALQKLQKLFLSLKKRNQLKDNRNSIDKLACGFSETKNILR